jgi:hypothetical protein
MAPESVILVVYTPFNINHASSKKTRTLDQEIHLLQALAVTGINDFLVPSQSYCTALIFNVCVILKVVSSRF